MKNKVKEVSVSRYIKLGLPNYSSDQLGASVTVEVGNGDQKAFKEAWELLDKQIKAQIEEKGYEYLWERVEAKSKDPDPDWIKKGGL